jgi:hypothetical protein
MKMIRKMRGICRKHCWSLLGNSVVSKADNHGFGPWLPEENLKFECTLQEQNFKFDLAPTMPRHKKGVTWGHPFCAQATSYGGNLGEKICWGTPFYMGWDNFAKLTLQGKSIALGLPCKTMILLGLFIILQGNLPNMSFATSVIANTALEKCWNSSLIRYLQWIV